MLQNTIKKENEKITAATADDLKQISFLFGQPTNQPQSFGNEFLIKRGNKYFPFKLYLETDSGRNSQTPPKRRSTYGRPGTPRRSSTVNISSPTSPAQSSTSRQYRSTHGRQSTPRNRSSQGNASDNSPSHFRPTYGRKGTPHPKGGERSRSRSRSRSQSKPPTPAPNRGQRRRSRSGSKSQSRTTPRTNRKLFGDADNDE